MLRGTPRRAFSVWEGSGKGGGRGVEGEGGEWKGGRGMEGRDGRGGRGGEWKGERRGVKKGGSWNGKGRRKGMGEGKGGGGGIDNHSNDICETEHNIGSKFSSLKRKRMTLLIHAWKL